MKETKAHSNVIVLLCIGHCKHFDFMKAIIKRTAFLQRRNNIL